MLLQYIVNRPAKSTIENQSAKLFADLAHLCSAKSLLKDDKSYYSLCVMSSCTKHTLGNCSGVKMGIAVTDF